MALNFTKDDTNIGHDLLFKNLIFRAFVSWFYIVKEHFRNLVSHGMTTVGLTSPGIIYLFQEKLQDTPRVAPALFLP